MARSIQESLYTKGNQSTQYNLGSELAYPRERWQAAASV